jgi:hypothetical protein
MSHDPLFESAWLKWAHAIVHSQTLERDLDAARVDGNIDPVRSFRTEYHPKRHGFAIIVEDVDLVPVRWRLLIGDIASNYRAAVDHLAWALVTRGRTPPGTGKLRPRAEGSVYFPIYEDRLKYNAQLAHKLPGVRRADAAIVRRAQPYRSGARARPRHPLVILASINNSDKHRTIQPLWAFPSRVDIEVTRARDCALVERAHWRRRAISLEEGAEVGFMLARKRGSNPELEVQLRVTAEPTIGNRISIREWSHATGIGVFNLLRQFSEQPPAIHEIGAELAPLPGS